MTERFIKTSPSFRLFLAFAELQTDMTDLTADLQSLGIPTLDHKSYVMKVFFPGVTDHPILNDPKVIRRHNNASALLVVAVFKRAFSFACCSAA